MGGALAEPRGRAGTFCPGTLEHDQLREVTAKVHVMNELIDEAVGRVPQRVAARGFADDTDVLFTTDHGELQGDYGLLYKGPFHTDSLMRLPLVLAPGAVRRRRAGGGEGPGRAGRPRADVLRHRRRRARLLDGGHARCR